MLLKFPKGPQGPLRPQLKEASLGPSHPPPWGCGSTEPKAIRRVREAPWLLPFLFSWESHLYFIIMIIII